ncbi:MAG: beta-N-acetylhexosaminidase [Alphaproteobacteria bacterium]|nr:beta-N-acetylhexosaminidase [Alphaproteobacteria bacterium]
MRSRVIFGCSGPVLMPEERNFFRDVQPWGFILFSRNVVDKSQLVRLVSALRDVIADPRAPVLIDQEGGRVARLNPPIWANRPPAATLGRLHEVSHDVACEAVYLNARLIAADLAELGINVNCTPVLDLPVAGSHDVIGDRAFGGDSALVVELGRIVIDGMLEGGVLPVMKHIPGHGRAAADSHLALPRVTVAADILSATDFVPFRCLNHCPLAMTAHVVYEAIDAERPATTSPRVIRRVIRGEIGFEGLLMSDDISMKALSGSLSARAKGTLFAGCDVVLHCSGNMEEMKEVAAEAKSMEGIEFERAERALARLQAPAAFDQERASRRLTELLGSQA